MRPRTPSRALALVAAAGLLAASCGTGKPATVKNDASGAAATAATPSTAAPAASPAALPSAAPASTAPAGTATPVIDPGDGGHYAPRLDPASFVPVIDNPYLPLRPGASWVYQGVLNGERQRIEVVVTPGHRTILGIPATVVRDTVFGADGQPVEITTDWFAQDRTGAVWYLGEDSRDVEHGKVTSTKGSWLAGVKGARPGIAMLAAPAAGKAYRQEYFPGEAEDLAEVTRTGTAVVVPTGRYRKVVVTREWTPLEPRNLEDKSYAPGVGNVLVSFAAGERGRFELVRFTPGRG